MTVHVELEPIESKRGMRICPECHRRSMRLVETLKHDVPCDRGQIAATRTFSCTANHCDTSVRFLDISQGVTSKRGIMPRSTDPNSTRGNPSEVETEVTEERIVIKA